MDKSSSLSSLIWSSADDVLRGLFKPSEYGRVILPFVVMRRLDCVLEPRKDEVYELHNKYKELSDSSPVIQRQLGLRFFNTSRFDLSRIKSDPSNVLMNFNNYVQGYSKAVLDIIENFSITPLVEKLHKQKRLYLLIDKFTEFNLHPDKIDNHQMGSIYEELLRKFSEMSNEESGDHFTPRDVVKLLVSFVFGGDKVDLQGEGKIRSVFDPCCGTGGMLTIGKEWVLENINPDLKIELYGQELNDVTYAICKSDLLMMDENPENIQGPCSSISDDRHQGRKFDYMITNPPFGVSWKSEKEFVNAESKDPKGRFFAGTPRSSDGSLLFLQHLIHKMEPKGSRIGIVFNGSPLFTGDAGSGESEIRRWIIENDYLECIVQLPDQMFFNTGITTYFWVVTNKKSLDRKGKIQLINGSSFHQIMKKSLGSKRKWITPEQSDKLFNIYRLFEESEHSKIYPNNFFGYTKIVIEQSLIEDGKLKTDRQGTPKPDTSKRDNERVPLSESIEEYFETEVKPHLPDSWMDRSKDKIGYEINFAKYFYKFTPLRSLEEISQDLTTLDKEISDLSSLIEGLDPNVEMKDSGVEWIGEIPSTWKRGKLYQHGCLTNGSTPSRKVDKYWENGTISWMSSGEVNKKTIKEIDTKISELGFQNSSLELLPVGTVMVGLNGQGKTKGTVGILETETTCNQSLCGIVSRGTIFPKYLYFYLESQYKPLRGLVGEGQREGISVSFLSRYPVSVPSLEEQKLISRYLDKKTEQIDSLIEKAQKKIELLKEYRQSLISSVVTGKVRVTENMI